MAQTVSDEELEAKRSKVAKLREQIADASATAAVRVREQENTVEAAQLDAEAARLELQLHEAKQAARVSTVKEATTPLVASAKEQMRAAEQQLAAAQGNGSPGAPKDPAPEDDKATEKVEAKTEAKAEAKATDKTEKES